MANENVDVMRGEPKVAIRKLAWPIIISMLLTASYNIIDGIWVAGLGEMAIAAIGFVTPVYMILNGVSVGLSVGANSIISRYVGADNKHNVDSAASHSLLIFLIASVILTVVLLVFQGNILSIYGASGETLDLGIQYGTILFAGLVTFMLANGCSGILRGEGDMKRALVAVVASVCLNAVLDPLFIYVFGLGVSGAAFATVFSSLCSALVILYWLLVKRDTYCDISFKGFRFDKCLVKKILGVGIPASLELCVLSVSIACFLGIITSIAGNMGVAAYSSGIRLYLIAIMPLSGLASAIVAVTGANYGGGKGGGISEAHMYGTKLGMVLGLCMCVIFLLFSNQLALIFAYTASTVHLVPYISGFLQIIGLSFPFIAMATAAGGFYQGVGRGSFSLFLIILREIICTVPLTYLFGIILGWGLIGVWIGLSLGRALAGLLAFIFSRVSIGKLSKKLSAL